MPEYFNHLLFGIFPYIALITLIVGSILRYDREPYTWRAGSSQLLRRKQLIMGSALFHAGILIVLVGHVFGLLVPIGVYEGLGVKHEWKQVLAMLGGGIAGIISFIGATLLLHRRLFDPRIRNNSSFGDTWILILLWAQLLLGLLTIPVSMSHLDGHEMVKFMNWANGIFTFNAQASGFIADVSPVFKLHIVLGLLIFLVFPFTRLVHMFSIPVRYLMRPGYQIVRSRKPEFRRGG